MTEEKRVDRETDLQDADLPRDDDLIDAGVDYNADLQGIAPQQVGDRTERSESDELADEIGPADAISKTLTGRHYEQNRNDHEPNRYADSSGLEEEFGEEIPWIADPDKVEESANVETAEPADYREETAAEVAPATFGGNEANADRTENVAEVEDAEAGGTALGWTGLVLSILSLFFLPVLMATAGIVTGFFAYRGGARSLGLWSIGVGAFSLLMGLFFIPFVVR